MLFSPSKALEGAPLSWDDDIIRKFELLTEETLDHSFVKAKRPHSSCHNPVDRVLVLQDDCLSGSVADTEPADGRCAIKNIFAFIVKLGSGNFGNVTLMQSLLHPTRFFAAKSITEIFTSSLTRMSAAPARKLKHEEFFEVLTHAVSGEKCGASHHYPAVSNLLREVRVAQELPPHPHIARCHGIIVAQHGAEASDQCVNRFPAPRSPPPSVDMHIVMELGAGGTLGELLEQQRDHIAEEHLVCWLSQLLQGLACMHKAGVLHRDIKPSNILLRRRVTPATWESEVQLFLTDFGVAAAVADSDTETERTVVGSCAYLPPEVARYWGYRSRCPYSYASDMWSTAAIFYVFLAGGGLGMDGGMSALFCNSIRLSRSSALKPSVDDVVASQLWVSRGRYPPLSLLAAIPLIDDDDLWLAIKNGAQCHEAVKSGTTTADSVSTVTGGSETMFGDTSMDNRHWRFTGVCDLRPEKGGENASEWPQWIFTPSVQLMARAVRARAPSPEFLGLIDAMMSYNPADRPTAKTLLLESTIFSVRLPWWEKSVESAVRRVAAGEEDIILDVCVGDTDEEEEEDEEELALLGRAMTPIIPPKENAGYVPVSIVYWRKVAFGDGWTNLEEDSANVTLVAHFLKALMSLRAYDKVADPSAGNEGGNKCEPRQKIMIYRPESLQIVERVFVQLHDTDVSVGADCCDGPLFRELSCRGLDVRFFFHIQIKLVGSFGAQKYFLPDLLDDHEDVIDEEEMATCAMEVLVATLSTWLNQRSTRDYRAALDVLPWVSWSHGPVINGTRRYFTIEYVAAAPLCKYGLSHRTAPINITGNVRSVFMEWRANLKEAFRCTQSGITQDGCILENHLNQCLDSLSDVELKLIENTEGGPLSPAYPPVDRVTQWICIRPPPSFEECVECLKTIGAGKLEVNTWVTEHAAELFFRTEGDIILRDRTVVRLPCEGSCLRYRCDC
uniref:WGS project CAEQ00000000 data, annotated contig 397 n=1 Tax=Trypanosoma congolense (strain IL3000) TaxID=1068625 RepID=F9WFL0_TRYCI|nr:unnamed protein product [Trypanosoma congolense IL3000]